MSIEEQELFELVSMLHEGTITPEQHDRLDKELSNDDALRQLYYVYTDVHLLLTRRFAAHDPLPATNQVRPEGIGPADSRRGLRVWTHLFSIAAAIAIVLGVQLVFRDELQLPGEEAANYSVDRGSSSPTYIATLLRSADCVWVGSERPKFDGQRLLTNELQLEQGIAEFRFDAGVRLVMEGPAFLTIESATSATLSSGRIVLHGNEMDGPFSLKTPVGTLLDIGTEYGAMVDPEGTTEVHVFEGEVSVVPGESRRSTIQPQQLLGGQAVRLDFTGSKSVPLAAKQFKRQIPETSLPSLKSKGELLAYEGFDYETPTLSDGVGGQGWLGRWRDWYGKNAKAPSAAIRTDSTFGDGTCLHLSRGEDVSWRTLEHPVDLSHDGVYYLSFSLKKLNELPRGNSQFGSVTLRSSDFPSDNNKLSFGMSSERALALTHNQQQLMSAPPIPMDQNTFIIAKIMASHRMPDQVMVRWYSPLETVGKVEPHTWSIMSVPEYSDAVFRELSVRVGGDVEFLVDDICISTSWNKAVERMWARQR